MAPTTSRRAALAALTVLLAAAGPSAAEQATHEEIREFTVGSQPPPGAPAVLAPPPNPLGADDRCDLGCDVATTGLRAVVVDVRGPYGDPYQYQYQRVGCAGQADAPRDGTGRKVVDVEGCASLVVRPAAIDMWTHAWTCTYQPRFLTPWSQDLPDGKGVPSSVTVPVADPTTDGDAYTEPAACALAHCVVADTTRANPCLPDYQTQATGTVRFSY